MFGMEVPKGGWKWDGRPPHCDHRILHSPSSGCQVCCEHAAILQYVRLMWNINFTGEHKEYDEHGDRMLPCPAEVARPFTLLNAWSGNKAKTKEEWKDMEKKFKEELATMFPDVDGD